MDPSYKLATGKGAVLKRTLFSEGDSGISSAANSEFASHSVRGVIASQFLAGVVENPHDEHFEDHFYNQLFASKSDTNKRIRLLIDEISKSVTASDWLLASRNSPLQITELGRAVNNSGFSPSSSRLIAEALSSAPKGASVIELVAFLLASVGDLPEQSNAKFRKLVDHAKQAKGGSTLKKGKPKLLISITDLPMLIERWLEGKRPIEMFAELPAVIRSKRNPPFADWLAGLPDPTSWDDQFDKFCDFLNSVFFEFVPWLLRACNLLCPHLQEKPQFEDWSVLGDMFRRDSDVTNASDLKQNE